MLIESEEESKLDRVLRPKTLSDFVGQDDLKEKLKIAIKAAKDRNEPLCHILIKSAPGFGKTTLANIIANEYGTECKTVMATAVNSLSDLLGILTKAKPNDVIFLDECHRINARLQESIYSAMEDFKVSIRVANQKIVHIQISPFCLIGATTHAGKLSEPLVERFGIVHDLSEYSDDQLALIVRANTFKLGLKTQNDQVFINIAKRARGTPRCANKLLHRIRDYVQVKNNNLITDSCVEETCQLEGIDHNGLNALDILYMKQLYEHWAGGPVGLNAISCVLNQGPVTVERYIEPILLRKGLISRIKNGRVLTVEGFNYILGNNNG